MRLKPKAMLDSFPRQLKQTAITDNSPIRLSEQSGLTVYIRNRDHLAESFRLTLLHRDKSAVLTFPYYARVISRRKFFSPNQLPRNAKPD